MKKMTVLLGICIGIAGASQAATVTWGGSESIYWGNTNNWNTGYLPGATAIDSGIIASASPVNVTGNFSVVTFGTDLTVRSDETLNVQADFTNWDQIRIGWNSGHVGYVNHSVGEVGAVDLFVGNLSGTASGNSIYTMTGGTLTLSDELLSRDQGEFNQSAGTTVAARLNTINGGSASLSGGSTTISGTMNVGSGTTAAVSGTGSLTANTVTANGTLDVSGGTINATTLNANDTVNQSGGTANTKLNVGSGGNYNLTGGNLNATVASDVTVDGTLTINGGTLSQNLNSASDTTEINGSGVVVLESGLLQTTNGIAQSVVNLRANMEISGGTLDLGGQSRLYTDLKVIGDAATIQIDRLGANRTQASFTFELGANGVSTIEGAGGYAALVGASLLVDGSDYVHGGGTFTNLLFNPVNLASMFNVSDVTITNFADGLTVNFFQDQSAGADWVGIEIIPEPAVLGLIVIFGGGLLVSRRIFNI